MFSQSHLFGKKVGGMARTSLLALNMESRIQMYGKTCIGMPTHKMVMITP